MRKHVRIALVIASIAALSSVARASDDSAIRPYFGASYEFGSLKFEDSPGYASNVSGWSPIVGLNLSKHFALEGTWLCATGERAASGTLSYHTAITGGTLGLMMRLPLGDTGFTPFVQGGVSFYRMKASSFELSISSVTGNRITTFTQLVNKSEVFPIGVIGLGYQYSGIELRGHARVQPINMENHGEYMVTYGGGLIFHL